MAKLRRVSNKGEPVGWMHDCPGCDAPHVIYVEQPSPSTGARWTFDGNMDAPTFSPSVLCFHSAGHWEGEHWVPTGPRITDCHYFVRKGMIEFCGDSPHKLAGQTVPLPEWPEHDDDRDPARQ